MTGSRDRSPNANPSFLQVPSSSGIQASAFLVDGGLAAFRDPRVESCKEAAGVLDVSYTGEARLCHEGALPASFLEAAAPLDVSLFPHRHVPEEDVLNLAVGCQSDDGPGHATNEGRQLAADAEFDH